MDVFRGERLCRECLIGPEADLDVTDYAQPYRHPLAAAQLWGESEPEETLL